MQIVDTEIPDVKIVTPSTNEDFRGFFSETYNRQSLSDAGIALEFVQDNQVNSPLKGTVRALHFQLPPCAQAKLVRVSRGTIFDVALDLRKDSATFGRHVSAVISAKDRNQIFVPIGFAHGYCTLEPDTEVLYKTSQFYSPDHERGVFWNDPALGIPWPIDPGSAVISERDSKQPILTELVDYFTLEST